MEVKRQKEVYVIGHKNPDTDSICSAIAYASLKNEILAKIEQGESIEQYQDFLIEGEAGEKAVYIPARAGQINTETNYVLRKFRQKTILRISIIWNSK